MALKKAVWFKWAVRIWGLGKLTTSIVQSGLFCIFKYSTLIILFVVLIYCWICCPIHCSTLSTVTFKMAPEALPTKKGRGIDKYLPWHQNFPINCRHFPTKTRCDVFPLIPGIFTHQHSRNFFLLSMMYKSMLCDARKIPLLLMVFFINRDALFSRDNLFPINFFAVIGSEFLLHPFLASSHRATFCVQL